MCCAVFLPIWCLTFDLELFKPSTAVYLKVRSVQMLTTLQPIYLILT